MGGRGTRLDVNTYLSSLERRTSDYKTLYQEGNIKIIMQNRTGPISAPEFSNTAERVYLTLNKNLTIKEIGIYKNHEKLYSIHPNDPGEKLHMHGRLKIHQQREKFMPEEWNNDHWEIYHKAIDFYNRKMK